MDEIRADPKYNYTTPCHSVNIEPGGTCKPAPGGDIITALNNAYTELQHPEKLSPEQVKFDLLVLFHLCGDLLQPLHAGYGLDKGGNTYQVKYNCKGTNLYTIRDSRIIEAENITLAGDLTPKPENVSSKNFRKHITDPVDIMVPLKISRGKLPYVYDLKGHKLDNDYMKANRSLVINQLRNGAILLTNCLEPLFSRMTNAPTGNHPPLHQHPTRSLQIPERP